MENETVQLYCNMCGRVSENDKEEEMNPFKWIEWSRNQTIQDPKHPPSYKFYGDK